jgi:hypothetical protein
MGYGLDGLSSIPSKEKDFSVLRSIQICSGANPAICPIITRAFFSRVKATGA